MPRPAEPVPVSVVVPTWNRAASLLTTLDSVFAQTAPPREVIVVDDGSPDDTEARVAPLAAAGRVRYVRQANAGTAAARNAGAALAAGEYVCFLDDHDLLFPDALRVLTAELARHPGAAFAYGGVVTFGGAPPATRPSFGGLGRAADPGAFLDGNQIGSPGQVLIRRSAFRAAGGFDGTIWGTDDWDLWLRLLARNAARVVPAEVLACRLHADSASRDVARMYRSSLRVARHHLARVPAEGRVAQRRRTYVLLRAHHAPQLVARVLADARAGAWRRAAGAARAWAATWALDLGARAAAGGAASRSARVPNARLPNEWVPNRALPYSARSVAAGSTRATRRAGA